MSSQKASVWGKSKARSGSVVLSDLGTGRGPFQHSPASYQTGLEVTSKDSFVVSNQIACLTLMNVWKEPLVCMGKQK